MDLVSPKGVGVILRSLKIDYKFVWLISFPPPDSLLTSACAAAAHDVPR